MVLSCENRENHNEKDYYIEWDNTSLVCISDEGGYPRLIRLNDESLLAVFETEEVM